MSRNINNPSKRILPEEEIQPWNAQDFTHLNLIQSPLLNDYHSLEIHKAPPNPEEAKVAQVQSQRTAVKTLNFIDNLRRYEKKKVELNSIRRETNFIIKNKQRIMQDFALQPEQNKKTNFLKTNLYLQEKSLHRLDQNITLASSVQPLNWSLIMSYETQRSKQKPKHKDIQSFLRFQSQKKEQERQNRGLSFVHNINFTKFQELNLQKIVKLNGTIRKRSLKSSQSQSRQNVDETQPSIHQIRLIQNASQRASNPFQFQQRQIPKTSYSARGPAKHNPSFCRIQLIGTKNVVVAPKIQPTAGLRMIHSSQKNRPLNKLLDIKGNKMQRCQKSIKNV